MKTLNKIPDSVQHAGFAKRLKAFAFDYLIISGYIILLGITTFVISKVSLSFGYLLRWPENPILADLMAFVTLILPVALYFTFSESSPKRATWGKQKVGIQVVKANGEKITHIQALIRSSVKFLPWQIAHTSIFQIKEVIPGGEVEPFDITGFVLVYVLVGIYIAAVFISKKRRTPYDCVAGSYVIVNQ